jgi:hypothetical protein
VPLIQIDIFVLTALFASMGKAIPHEATCPNFVSGFHQGRVMSERMIIDHPLPKGPMPNYVEHKEGVNQVGKLSAEAVVREYDAFWTAHEARIRTIKARIESKWRRLASR